MEKNHTSKTPLSLFSSSIYLAKIDPHVIVQCFSFGLMLPASKKSSLMIKFSRVSRALTGTLADKTAVIVQQVQWKWEAGSAGSCHLSFLLQIRKRTSI